MPVWLMAVLGLGIAAVVVIVFPLGPSEFLESGGAAMRLHTKEELCAVRAGSILKEATSSGSKPSCQWCCS